MRTLENAAWPPDAEPCLNIVIFTCTKSYKAAFAAKNALEEVIYSTMKIDTIAK